MLQSKKKTKVSATLAGLLWSDRRLKPRLVTAVELEWRPSRAFLFAFGSLIVVSVCVSLEAACLALALPTIASELKGSSVEAFWTGSSFLLASAVSQPIFASFSILFGRKLVRITPALSTTSSLPKPLRLDNVVFCAPGSVLEIQQIRPLEYVADLPDLDDTNILCVLLHWLRHLRSGSKLHRPVSWAYDYGDWRSVS